MFMGDFNAIVQRDKRIASTTCFSFEPLRPIAPVSIPPWPGSRTTTRLPPLFFAFGLLCPLLVFNGSSLAMACDIPDNVRAAKPAFSTWRREVSVFSGLKVLIRPEL